MSDQPLPTAGWYPDPAGQGSRYWDGTRWTEHTQPLAPAPVAPASPQAPWATAGAATIQPVSGVPAAPAAASGSALSSLLQSLQRGEGLALVLVAAVVLVLSTFLPWGKLSLDAGPGAEFSDSKNAWAGDVPWLIRGFSAEDYRVAVAKQDGSTPSNGTDLIIILPLTIAAGALVVATRQGKKIGHAAEILAGCCGLLVLLLVLEIVHLRSWTGDLQDAIDRANGTAKVTGGAAFGLYLATVAGAVMTYGAVRNLMTERAAHAPG
jgi:hypothetical protein